MKKITLFALLIIATSFTNAQQKTASNNTSATPNQCDELKKENDFLKKELKLNEPIKKVEQDDIEIKLVAAKGNIKTQTIKLEYLITNKIKIRRFRINGNDDQFVSIEGDLIPVIKSYSVQSLDLVTDVPIKTIIEIGTILPENKIIKLATFIYKLGEYPWVNGMAEFKDIPIDWK